MIGFILTSVLAFSGVARAQTEGPPNEPPYTNDLEEEFDQAARAGGPATELKAGSEAPAIPTPAPAPEIVPVTPAEAAVAEEGGEGMVRQLPPSGQSRYIKHPGAKKGLTLIDRDGSYHYTPTKFARREQTSTLRLGVIKPPPTIEAEVAGGTIDYQTVYGSGNPFTLLYDYEWTPFQAFGELGAQLGFGVFTSQGNGRFVDDGSIAHEKYTFYGLPINLGVVYRLRYFNKQWLIPYVAGGGTYFVLGEMRDDGKAPHFVGTPAAYGAGGLMFNVSRLDADTGFILDSEYGIASLYMTLEARQVQSVNKELDVSGTVLTLGFGADY